MSDISATGTYPRDRSLMMSLGLSVGRFCRDWTDLGTVVIHEADSEIPFPTTVKVEVSALPAQFWRFTVTRPVDDLGPRRPETLVVQTGSGAFSDYWPSVRHVADNCFTVVAASSRRPDDG